MKRYWPIIVAAAAPAVVVFLIYLTAPASEGARAKLQQDIDQELAKARRLLAAYEPTQQMLLAGEQRLTGKEGPFEITDARLQKMSSAWDKSSSYVEQESPIKPVSADLQRALGEAADLCRRRVGGAEKQPSAEAANDAAGARRLVTDWLQANESRLKDAIRIVDAAMGLSTSSGEETLSGREDVEANRLRAILAYHYAESLRREALLDRSRVERLSERLLSLHGDWIGVTADIAVAERALEGSSDAMPASGAATAASASAPATAKARETAKAQGGAPAESRGTAAAPAKSSKVLGKVFGAIRGTVSDALPGGKIAAASEPAKAAPTPAAEEPAAEPSAPIAVELEPLQRIQPLRDRIADLERQKAEALKRAKGLETKITEELTPPRDRLAGEIRQRREAAAAAETKMAEMENKGFDPRNAGALNQRTAEYEAQSKIAREASRQADLLEFGGYTNATLVTETEDWHTARIAPARAGEPLAAQKCLRQYDQEIRLATAAIQGEQRAVEVLDKRLQTLRTLQAYYDAQLKGGAMPASTQPAATQMVVPGLRGRHDEIVGEAKSLVALLDAAAKAADANDDAAIAELGRGISAAKQARQSAEKRTREAQGAQPQGGEPNPRLQRIEQEDWRAGDADAILGDLQLLLATVHYQRALARERLAAVLDSVARMGLTVDAAAARTAAAADKPAALNAAQDAQKAYTDAEPRLKKDWTVHMNLAAAYYLLSQLTQGPQASQFLESARKEYAAGTSGADEKNPDRKPYADRAEAIRKAQAKPKRPG